MQIQHSISLSNYATWKVGGPAEWFAEPKNLEELIFLTKWAQKKNIRCHLIGAGSNLLIHDSGIKGLCICMRKFHGIEIEPERGSIEAFSGESIPGLTRKAAKAGLQGLEWAVGIPGTVGGAVAMNAGAQGSCIANSLKSVQILPLNGDSPFLLTNKELNFEYRKSLLQDKELIILSAKFKLQPGHNKSKLMDITNKNLNHRKRTQPYSLPSCGSVFRNPEPLKAGYLIESIGLKGYRIGGAEISKVHANFIVNNGDATAMEIKELIKHVQNKIYTTHGLFLKPEVKQLGFDENN